MKTPTPGRFTRTHNASTTKRVECPGLVFPDWLKDSNFRKTPGFPIGTDEANLELSDAPYFTACPNSFLGDMIRHYGMPYSTEDGYHTEPYASDVAAGKSHTIYMAHSYHTKVCRNDISEVQQLELSVTDERSAIQWVRRLLATQPMAFKDIQPAYMKETRLAWQKHEAPVDLRDILDQNFVQDERALWRVPDPDKEGDLEQIRHRDLLREFQTYTVSKGKLRLLKTEAHRAGFKDALQRCEYAAIVDMANRVPESVIQEDAALLMCVDNAVMRTGDGE